MKRRLGQTLAAAAAKAEAEGSIKAEQIIVRDFKSSAHTLELLISDTVCQQNGLRIFDLNQNVPGSRQSLVQSDDFNAAEQSHGIEALLCFEYGFRIERRVLV